MINLAGLRYRNAFSRQGGPIERIETADFTVENSRMFQANAFMRTGLLAPGSNRSVYSDAAGSGTHASTTKHPPARTRSSSFLVTRATVARAAPRARDPVSPMNTCAG